jgi:hypothetical protein
MIPRLTGTMKTIAGIGTVVCRKRDRSWVLLIQVLFPAAISALAAIAL